MTRLFVSCKKSGLILFLLFTVLTIQSALAQDNNGSLVLSGATIINGISDSPMSGYSIYIEGNTIRELIPAGAPLPRGVEVVNLNGKYVLPGLIDTHVHWLDWMGELFVNYGVTSIVALYEVDKAMRNDSQASFALPRLYHSANRPPFPADGSAADIRRVMRDWLDKEPDIAHFPTHNSNISRAYAIAAREAHRAGFIIFGHAENAPQAIEDGLDIVEHIWAYGQAVMSDQELQAFQRGDYLTWANHMTGKWERLDGMIQDSVNQGIYLNPTLVYEWGGLSVNANQRELDDYSALRNPNLTYFPPNIAGSLLAKHRQIKNFSRRYGNLPMLEFLPVQDRAEFEEGYRNIKEFVRRFVTAGGKIMAGTDAITGGIPGLGLHQEMQMLVEAGLTPMQALKSASRWSAEELEGKDGKRGPAKVGSIEAGKFADLLVINANPLVDIRNTQQIERVMKNGRWVPLGLHPDYYTHTGPPRAIAGSTFAPVVSSVTPAMITAGSKGTRVSVEGSGFQMISQIQVNGITVETDFVSPRRLEFDLPDGMAASAGPNPYVSPGPYQQDAIIGYKAIEVRAYNPPPEGGTSNTINIMVTP